jgi:3,4-dihydroxy 2-butanone 4-phosphate synthase/GTP cyclohydrolase II
MSGLSPIEDLIADAKAGRMFILVDDEDRENEGDLVIPAEKADAEAVNFMAKYGRGLICLALTKERVEELSLPLMSAHNASRHQTAFTVSIEAREGISTGISAADRALTISNAIDPQKGASSIVSPGHIFPLVAKPGGVLVRAGHTEAAVDIAKLASLNPAGVICEIMNEDGSMARLPDLISFAKLHGLRIGAIADLIAYRRRTEKLVKLTHKTKLNSRYGGEFTLCVYTNTLEYAEHIALIKGDIKSDETILVRMHVLDILRDVLGDADSGGDALLHSAMQRIEREGRGVVVLLREPRKDQLSARISADLQGQISKTSLRDYGIGAQILQDIGVRKMRLLSNAKRPVIGLEGYGLAIDGYEPLP